MISAGTSAGESAPLIGDVGATVAGVVIALDRQERGQTPTSATVEIADRHHIPVIALGHLSGLLSYLERRPATESHLSAVHAYRARHGCENEASVRRG